MYVTFLLSIKNHNLHNYVHLIYPNELEIKYITESDKSASYLYILLGIDSSARLTTTLYGKCDDIDFSIVKFLFLWSNTPFSTAYCVYISQFIPYPRACFAYEDFLQEVQGPHCSLVILAKYVAYKHMQSFLSLLWPQLLWGHGFNNFIWQ
jgi:hypothetical protein